MTDLVVMLPCPQCRRPHGWTPRVAGTRVICSCGKPFRLPRVDDQDDPEDIAYSLEPAYDSHGKRLGDNRADMDEAPADQPARGTADNLAQAADAPTSLPASMKGARRRRNVPEPEPAPALSRYAPVIAAVVLLLFLGVGVWSLLRTGNSSTAPPAKGVAAAPGVPALSGDDAEVLQAIDTYGATELKAWIKENSRANLLGMSRNQADALADRIYQLGAIRVVAFGSVISSSVAIQLPSDPQKRRAIFNWLAERRRDTSYPIPPDTGQNYLLYRLAP
jgi:hypothetical protein